MAIQAQLLTDQSFRFSLGSPHDSVMESTGSGFNRSFSIPRQQQLTLFDLFQNSNQRSLLFSQSLPTPIEKQGMEIDRFISIQNERLRQALQEQIKSQISTMMKKYESKIQSVLQQKDEEILKATQRRMELEDVLRTMETENQAWQMAAKEKEAIAASLNSKIQRLRETTARLAINAAEDAESCFENEEQTTRKMICRCCASRKACVVMLPCRHLCSCKDCEAVLDYCPVCKMAKKATLEALTL